VWLATGSKPPRWAKEIHIVLDNLSAHKTPAVEKFLAQHPEGRFHFTPTYSSWSNQVELWFAKIQCDVISRGVFTSVADLQENYTSTSALMLNRLDRSAGPPLTLSAESVLTKSPGRLTSDDLADDHR
jgi:DDE superfamily endonuclease